MPMGTSPRDIFHNGLWYGRETEYGASFPVNTAVEQPNALAPSQFRDVSTTRQSVAYPGGALSVMLQYRLMPGATAVASQVLRVAINAVSDMDATGKLATAGGHVLLYQGDDLTLLASPSDPINRVDFQTEQAVGSEKTTLQILAGV